MILVDFVNNDDDILLADVDPDADPDVDFDDDIDDAAVKASTAESELSTWLILLFAVVSSSFSSFNSSYL